jgi:UDP-N-acetylglucosamine 2-epimerase (non-hydrolysing)
MIDSLLDSREARQAADTLRAARPRPRAAATPAGYGVVTLHRPSNVDDADTLRRCCRHCAEVSQRLPLVFAMHPRTRTNIERFGLADLLDPAAWLLLPPQGYLEMLGLMAGATLVLTDSGGLQEETTALGVPCLTMRENTERPITVEQGTNTMVGRDRGHPAGRGRHPGRPRQARPGARILGRPCRRAHRADLWLAARRRS